MIIRMIKGRPTSTKFPWGSRWPMISQGDGGPFNLDYTVETDQRRPPSHDDELDLMDDTPKTWS